MERRSHRSITPSRRLLESQAEQGRPSKRSRTPTSISTPTDATAGPGTSLFDRDDTITPSRPPIGAPNRERTRVNLFMRPPPRPIGPSRASLPDRARAALQFAGLDDDDLNSDEENEEESLDERNNPPQFVQPRERRNQAPRRRISVTMVALLATSDHF